MLGRLKVLDHLEPGKQCLWGTAPVLNLFVEFGVFLRYLFGADDSVLPEADQLGSVGGGFSVTDSTTWCYRDTCFVFNVLVFKVYVTASLRFLFQQRERLQRDFRF